MASDQQSNPMLALVQDFRSARDALGDRPSNEQFKEALQSIEAIDSSLADDLGNLLRESPPAGVDVDLFQALQQVKRDVLETKASISKVQPHVVVDLYRKFSHYDRIIMLAEGISVGDANVVQLLQAAAVGTSRMTSPTAAVPSIPFVESKVPETRPAEVEPSRYSTYFPIGKVSDTTFGDIFKDGNGWRTDDSPMSVHGPTKKKPPPPSSAGAGTYTPSRAKVVAVNDEPSEIKLNAKLLRMIENVASSKSKEFDASGKHFSSPLTYFPESLGMLDFLEQLDVSGNALVILPESIGQLLYLAKLDVSCNKLLELPLTIGRLPRLQILDAHHNSLTVLPPTLGDCEALEEIDLGFNNIAALPESIGKLENLRVFKAPLNKLTYLPRKFGDLRSLVELDVHYNALESLPESIGKLSSLQKMNVSANHFALKTLPGSIGQLTQLVELDVSENHIKVLPESFKHLASLQVLRMNNNPWLYPPPEVVKKGREAVMEHLATSHAPGYHPPSAAQEGSGSSSRRPRGLRRFMGAFHLSDVAGGGSTLEIQRSMSVPETVPGAPGKERPGKDKQ